MKKILFLLLLCVIFSNEIINAQSVENLQSKSRHWLSVNPGLGTGGHSHLWLATYLQYDYKLNSFFSIGAYAYYEYSYGFGLSGCWYPFGKSFYLGFNFGYDKWYRKIFDYDNNNQYFEYIQNYDGIDISPGLGWKIDFGKPGGLYISPSIKYRITIRWFNDSAQNMDLINRGYVGYFGIGYAFLII